MNYYVLIIKMQYLIYSPIVWFKLYIIGVRFKPFKCFFAGLPNLVKHAHSSIIIGKNSRFISRSSSNLIGKNHKCIISTHSKQASIVIGNNCGFSGTTIGCFKSIILENNVRCGANTVITDSDWHLDDPRSGIPKAVLIKSNVWLGYGSIILKGVTIGENSVIGAGSVVVKDIPANVVAAGNPCKVVKYFKENN